MKTLSNFENINKFLPLLYKYNINLYFEEYLSLKLILNKSFFRLVRSSGVLVVSDFTQTDRTNSWLGLTKP